MHGTKVQQISVSTCWEVRYFKTPLTSVVFGILNTLSAMTDAFSVATAADVNEANASAMLSKLVSVRLHIGKMALTRANKENGGDFVGNAKYAVMILEGAYDVLTNWLPASWMHAELRNETRDGPETVQMEHDGEEDDNAQNQQDMELTSHTLRNDTMHIEV